MLVLGWHGNPRLTESDRSDSFAYHDAAAAIFKDGKLVAAIEEERLNRVKHSSSFPARAIRFCLEQAKATLAELDAIAFDSAIEFCDYVSSRDASANPRIPIQGGREMLSAAFKREFNVDVSDKLFFCKHHMAHLFGAWYPSGFREALVVALDGYGDGAAGMVAHCDDEGVRTLRQFPESLSLGNFYQDLLYVLGYARFDEYKAMGLAPYGDPAVFEPLFRQMYRLQPEGRFTLLPPLDCHLLLREAGLDLKARRKGARFEQVHKDFAAALQSTLEVVVEHVVWHFQMVTNANRLCLSGGVAHNCATNGRLLRSGRFEQIYVQPAAHDAGNTIGAALAYAHEMGHPPGKDVMPHVFLGTDIGSAAEIGRQLEAWSPIIEFEYVENVAERAAAVIASGGVMAWVQGRSEFGPRALGNRSIIADPRPKNNKERINAMIKKREDFRPFAPAVLEDRLHDYFDVGGDMRSLPFMTIVVSVRKEARITLGAVTHVDGTARVQSVSKKDNPRFYDLIEAFDRLTGLPVVLNTSFNNNVEPIVDSIDDAVTTFVTTGLDSLIVGDWIVRKRADWSLSTSLGELMLSLPAIRKLIYGVNQAGKFYFGIEDSVVNPLSPEPPAEISREVFHMLVSNESCSIQQGYSKMRIENAATLESICQELLGLWAARKIRLSPTQSAVAASVTIA